METRAPALWLRLATAALACLLLGIAILVTAGPARADSRGEVTFLLGYPLMTADLDFNLKSNLNNKYSVGIQMNWFLSQMPAAFGILVQGAFAGPWGFAPVMQSAGTFTYYPLARPHNSFTIDNEVQVRTRSWIPFGRLQAGIASIVLNNPATGDRVGSTALSYGLVAGVDFPFDMSFKTGVEFGYFSTIGASGFSGEPIAVYGYNFTLRVTMPWN